MGIKLKFCFRMCLTEQRLKMEYFLGQGADKEHLVQFWLRLPLATRDNRPDMLLCHDAIVPAEEMPGLSGLEVVAGQRAVAV